jgi:dihydroxyacetone kinase
MTKLFDDPTTFSEDLLEGFCDLYADRVLPVPGGVVRATETPSGKVAVVVGGGSGHYPAFCGIVGPGFADGAVVGNVFTSPSTKEAVSVGRAAAGDSGLLFSTGNYAGDVMNFTLAQQQLAEEGIDTRVVFVTDDIASAPLEEIMKRRGIAPRPLTPSRYAMGLRKLCRRTDPGMMIDILLISAFIEARSCERFGALAPHLDLTAGNA